MSATGWSIYASTVPALGGNGLDSLSSRLMMQNQYSRTAAGESLWLNHTISSGGFGRRALV